jgi:hypothetical protein
MRARACWCASRSTPARLLVEDADRDQIAEHKTATGKGEMVVQPSHYGELPRRARTVEVKPRLAAAELTPGPGVGLHYAIPEVELRSLSIYTAFCEEAAHVASV